MAAENIISLCRIVEPFEVWSYLQSQISFFALLEIHANLRIDKSAFEEKEPKNLHQKAEIKIRKSYHVKNLSQSDAHMYCNISIMVR